MTQRAKVGPIVEPEASIRHTSNEDFGSFVKEVFTFKDISPNGRGAPSRIGIIWLFGFENSNQQ